MAKIEKTLQIKLKDFFELPDEEIKKIVEYIGNRNLTPTSHLYVLKEYQGKSIRDAALSFSEKYSNNAKANAPLAIIDVVLSSNRDYSLKVAPVIRKLRVDKSSPFINIKTFDQLLIFLKSNLSNFYKHYVEKKNNIPKKPKSENLFNKNEIEFLRKKLFFKEVNFKKVIMIFDILKALSDIKDKQKNELSDRDFIKYWADEYTDLQKFYMADKSFDVKNFEKSAFGSKISNVGIAVIQHLRMHFGAITFKPDQRIKEVLLYNFLSVDGENYASRDIDNKYVFPMMNKIAKVCHPDYNMICLDCMFVNYGSGYYRRNNKTGQLIDDILGALIYRLKQKDTSDCVIEYATGLSNTAIDALIDKYNN